MKNVMLIDAEGVKKSGYTHKNVLPETVDTTIRRVQQIQLKKIMGSKAYKDLLDKVSNSLPPSDPIIPLDPNTEELLKEYIQPYIVAAVDYRIISPLTYRHRSKSVGKGTDDNHIPVDTTEMTRLKDQMRQDMDSYEQDLRDKLNGNEDPCCEDNHVQSTTPWKSIKFR